ncbi:hypothetical protein EBA01_19705 [Xanthomonas oryzae pv. oryzae]|nr:hypothetical protein C0L89_19715 [Xanthomonas oryzae pv. oryzae]QBN29789.1 hypothetical protein EBA01_19705 [Xanthomonas oryzae pv. oryzae]QBN62534.1 hypothetical protein EBA10_19720 [Xanthomonas oryzae pv. oryzae]QBN66178.1 hypothetical protein EBA11_19675 [Xanthomonas oryzae pv. oryzae]
MLVVLSDSLGARSFAGNPYDGDTLAAQLKRTRGLLQDVDFTPDSGDHGREVDGVRVLYRGKVNNLRRLRRHRIKLRQTVERVIGRLEEAAG